MEFGFFEWLTHLSHQFDVADGMRQYSVMLETSRVGWFPLKAFFLLFIYLAFPEVQHLHIHHNK